MIQRDAGSSSMVDPQEVPMTGLMGALFAVGKPREPTGALGIVVKALSFSIAVWVIYAATFAFIDPLALSAIFLSFMLALLFLVVGAWPSSEKAQPPLADLLLMAADKMAEGSQNDARKDHR